MSGVPGNLDTGKQPPMTLPLRHFVVGLGFLFLGGLVGVATEIGLVSGISSIAHVHLLLVGWVCVTIMGAMTQFIPVWSGVSLYSRRLSSVQLWMVVVGLSGFALGLLTAELVMLPIFGSLILLGFWVFVYNIARTLWAVDGYDVTERHFAIALSFFVLLTVLGLLLALDFVWSIFGHVSVTRIDAIGAHATLAVFGAVLTTVFGALYQLATMFTQSDLHGIDRPLRRLEEIGYPVGVLALATARLFGIELLGVIGGALVVGSVFGFSIVLARRLYETQVDWTPMLSRYAVLAFAMAAWALLTAPAWIRDPLASSTRFGGPGSVHLLTIGVIGFVVLGTLYHIIPFIVWVHRYSDLLGIEAVPMIDDLYSDRIARIDFVVFVLGSGLIITGDLVSVPTPVSATGGFLLLVGTVLFVWNMMRVIHVHSPHSIGDVLGVTGRNTRSNEPGAEIEQQ